MSLRAKISTVGARLPRPSRITSPNLWPWLLVALALFAFSLRVYNLGKADLTFDESASAFIAGQPYDKMLAYLRAAIREHPPAYYVLLRTWTLAAGRSEYALRFLSVWFGVLSVALVYRVGRRAVHRTGALAAAALLAVQPFHVHYSQDARMYILMAVEGLLLFELFARVRFGPQRWYGWLAFGALAASAVLTHYLMALILAAINIYALTTLRLERPTLKFALAWFGAQALVGGVFAAYLALSQGAYFLEHQFHGFTLRSVAAQIGPARRMIKDTLWGVQARPWPWWSDAMFALVVFGLILAVLWLPRRTHSQPLTFGRLFLPIYLLVPLALTVATPERLSARYLAAIVPAYVLVLGLLVAWLADKHKLLGLVVFGALAAANLNMTQTNQTIIKSDYGHVVSYLNAHLGPGDAIIFNGPWQWVQQVYYPVTPMVSTAAAVGRGELPPEHIYVPLDPDAPVYWLTPEPSSLDPSITHQKLEEIAARFERAWVLPAAVESTDPQRVVSGWLTQHAYYSGHYEELELYTFSRTAQPEVAQDVKADFGAFRLRQVSLARVGVRPGEPALISLSLRVLDPPGGDLALTLQLVDRDGNAWASQALRPGNYFNPPSKWRAGDQLAARHGLIVPFGTPPGDYALRVGALLIPSEAPLEPSIDGAPLPVPYVEVGGLHVDAIGPEESAQDPSALPGEENLEPLDAVFGDGLALVGVRMAGREFWQGHYLAFELAWKPERTPGQDYRLRLALVDHSGREVTSHETQPVAAWYPTSQWAPGQLVLDRQALLIPPRQSPGAYTLRVGVLDSTGQPLPMTGTRTESVLGLFSRTLALDGTALDVGQITVRARERAFRAGRISHPLSVTLGGEIKLLGYDWDGPPRPGQTVRLVLYWQALREMDTPYTVFTHIVGPGETPAGQKDNWPRSGDYPTTFWMQGEVVTDEYLIPFAPQAAPGEYRLEVGLYDAKTGDRLPAVQDGQPVLNNAIVLERFRK